MTDISAIIDDFAFLDDWEDRYRYVLELGKQLEPVEPAEHCDANKVRGCASQVWLVTEISSGEADPVMRFRGDSDAHLVRGLIAILIATFTGKRASDVLATDAEAIFGEIGLREHLTSQRSNGLSSMLARIKADAKAAAQNAA